MFKILRIVTVLIVALFASSSFAGFQEGVSAYKSGNYAVAFKEFTNSAAQGNPTSQLYLGSMYASGQGVEKDDAQSAHWYLKAAEQGIAYAQNFVAILYAKGQGVAKDQVLAVKWYRKAAEQGLAVAQTNLGVRLLNGQGVGQDDVGAVYWFRKAAEQGDVNAQNNLGVMYINGQGVEKDDEQAFQWFSRAAEQGDLDAKNNLRLMEAASDINAPGKHPRNSSNNGLMGGAVQTKPLSLAAKVSTFAGSEAGGYADGAGKGALFYTPMGITTDGRFLYVVDRDNIRIRRIEIHTGVVTTLAGSDVEGDADGIGKKATFRSLSGITTDGKNLYVLDVENHNIRKIEILSGLVTTVVGTGDSGDIDAIGTAASFKSPIGITTDGMNLYVVDNNVSKIRKINLDNYEVSTIAGSRMEGETDGVGTEASFFRPTGITTDGTNLYVSDSANNKIRQIVISSGVVTTLAGSGQEGDDDGIGAAASFYFPGGITTDGNILYVADCLNRKVRKIVIETGVVTTLAGGHAYKTVDGVGADASFLRPCSITNDGQSLYVTDEGANLVRKIQ